MNRESAENQNEEGKAGGVPRRSSLCDSGQDDDVGEEGDIEEEKLGSNDEVHEMDPRSVERQQVQVIAKLNQVWRENGVKI